MENLLSIGILAGFISIVFFSLYYLGPTSAGIATRGNRFSENNAKTISIIFLVICVLTLAGYFGYSSFVKNEPVAQSESQTTLYTNDTYGIQFEYPKDWYLSNQDETSVVLSNYENVGEFNLENLPEDLETIFFFIRPADSSMTLDSILNDRSVERDVISTESFTTNSGVVGKKVTLYFSDHPVGNRTSIYFLKGDRLIEFYLGVRSEDSVEKLEEIAGSLIVK